MTLKFLILVLDPNVIVANSLNQTISTKNHSGISMVAFTR